MIKAIAIDDEPPALRIIEHFCKNNNQVDLVKTFTNPAQAMKFIVENKIDLMFIDIQMPGYNGLEFYSQLTNKPLAIFTTAFSEYAVEGFNLDAVDYLLKPYSKERFDKAIDKVIAKLQINTNENRTISLRKNYGILSVNTSEIKYIESFDDYVMIHLSSEKPLKIRITLKKIIEQLPDKEFIRIHRSYIVSIKNISKVRNKFIYIESVKIPLSSKYEQTFFERFHNV